MHTFYLQLTLLVLAIVGALDYVTANRNKETVGEQLTSHSANKLFTYFFSHKSKQAVQCQKEYREMLRFRDEPESILNQVQFFDKRFDHVANLDFARAYPFTAFICLYVDKDNIPFDELIRLDKRV